MVGPPTPREQYSTLQSGVEPPRLSKRNLPNGITVVVVVVVVVVAVVLAVSDGVIQCEGMSTPHEDFIVVLLLNISSFSYFSFFFIFFDIFHFFIF